MSDVRRRCLSALVLLGAVMPSVNAAQQTRSAAAAAPRLDCTESFVHAKGQSRKTGKLIRAYFAATDWCEWCKKLDKEALQTPMFAAWAQRNVVPLLVDYPSPDKQQSRAIAKQNEILAASYNIAKTPTLLF